MTDSLKPLIRRVRGGTPENGRNFLRGPALNTVRESPAYAIKISPKPE